MSERARMVLMLIDRAERPKQPLVVDIVRRQSRAAALPIAEIEYRLAKERVALTTAEIRMAEAVIAACEASAPLPFVGELP